MLLWYWDGRKYKVQDVGGYEADIATFRLAWGVFQSYYKAHVFPEASDTTLSLLGTLQNMVGICKFTVFDRHS